MKKILGVGNALVDVLAQVPNDLILKELSLPKGSMQLIGAARYEIVRGRLAAMKTHRTTGGSACNTILALARMGCAAGIIGKIGNDDAGSFFADSFRALGIETHLTRSDLPTGVASTFVTPDGQRTFGTYLGAAATLSPDDLREEWFAGYDYFYIEGYLVQNRALINRVVQLAKQAGLQICLDLASYNIVEADREFFTRFLEHIDIVFANEEEARAFTGGRPALESLAVLAGTCKTAVVKVGKNGVFVSDNGTVVHAAARDVPVVVDTTAAGDYFSAGFLYGLTRGLSARRCAEIGSLLAGHIIEVMGTALPEPTWRKLRETVESSQAMSAAESSSQPAAYV